MTGVQTCALPISLDGMHNLRETYSQVQIGTGETIYCNKIGDKCVTILQLDGSTHDIELKNCKYVPGLFTNLFSITKALEQDWRLSNEGLVLTISKNGLLIKFDQVLRTDSGAITAVEMLPRSEFAHVTLSHGKSININKLHLLLGHACENTLRHTAKYFGYDLSGHMKPCPECALSKTRATPVAKVTKVVSTTPGEQFYIDLSQPPLLSFGGSRYWLLIVDHYTDFCWSGFLCAKSDLRERVVRFLQGFRMLRPESNDWTII